MTARECPKCGETKPLDQFYRDKYSKDGHATSRCKACSKSHASAWRLENMDQARETTRKWRAANRKKDADSQRAWHRAHPGYNREMKLKHQYGITSSQWDSMYESQHGTCICCGEPFGSESPRRPNVEHCHATNQVFGLACNNCNVAVGHCKNSEARALLVADYIRRTRGSDLKIAEAA